MVVGVSGILELSGHEGGAIGGDQLVGAADGALHALGVRGAEHLGAEGPHDRDLFFGEALWDKELHLVTTIHADQRQSDACVPRGSLDNRSPRREFPILFGAADDPDGGTVLHTPARVQVFELGEHVGGSGGDQALQLQHRSLADQLGNIIGNAQAGDLGSF